MFKKIKKIQEGFKEETTTYVKKCGIEFFLKLTKYLKCNFGNEKTLSEKLHFFNSIYDIVVNKKNFRKNSILHF